MADFLPTSLLYISILLFLLAPARPMSPPLRVADIPADTMPAGEAVLATFHTRLALGARDVLPKGSICAIENLWTCVFQNLVPSISF